MEDRVYSVSEFNKIVKLKKIFQNFLKKLKNFLKNLILKMQLRKEMKCLNLKIYCWNFKEELWKTEYTV